MATDCAIGLVVIPIVLLGYSYFIYPLGVWLISRAFPMRRTTETVADWPAITITVPCYNEEQSIATTIESLLALDYPMNKCHILIISDASTDRTDEIVQSFADRGVELLRLQKRGGKTAAENAAAAHVRGEIVISTDATIRILPGSLKELVTALQDPTVGVASGRDVSVGDVHFAGNQGESGYVGYEMWVRSLETRLGGIVGASGCFFAIRRSLYENSFPEGLSRDFASCLIAREQGYRAVSVDSAQALVPRAPTLQVEYRRKVRTMARGLSTLRFMSHLLNPFRYGLFSLMLFSHKLCRWLLQLTMPLLPLAGILIAIEFPRSAGWLLVGSIACVAVAKLSWQWPAGRQMPRLLSAPGYLIWSTVAGLAAWAKFFRGEENPIWEPTRRSRSVT